MQEWIHFVQALHFVGPQMFHFWRHVLKTFLLTTPNDSAERRCAFLAALRSLNVAGSGLMDTAEAVIVRRSREATEIVVILRRDFERCILEEVEQ